MNWLFYVVLIKNWQNKYLNKIIKSTPTNAKQINYKLTSNYSKIQHKQTTLFILNEHANFDDSKNINNIKIFSVTF